MAKAKGYVLYRGASVLDGAPIVVIATMQTTNEKTGDMVQTWILREDVAPNQATKTGADASVCGDCPHRHYLGGACYVTVFQAPLQVWKAYRAGRYSDAVGEFYARIKHRRVRFGAYGDPAAAPLQIWADIAPRCAGFTGYTHQAEHARFNPGILSYVMQSVDTPEQARQARGRYFRVKRPDDPARAGEVECLADSVGKSCADCLLCDGGSKGKSVYINVHGARSSRYAPDLIARAA
jgi:hypothetical protein